MVRITGWMDPYAARTGQLRVRETRRPSGGVRRRWWRSGGLWIPTRRRLGAGGAQNGATTWAGEIRTPQSAAATTRKDDGGGGREELGQEHTFRRRRPRCNSGPGAAPWMDRPLVGTSKQVDGLIATYEATTPRHKQADGWVTATDQGGRRLYGRRRPWRTGAAAGGRRRARLDQKSTSCTYEKKINALIPC